MTSSTGVIASQDVYPVRLDIVSSELLEAGFDPLHHAFASGFIISETLLVLELDCGTNSAMRTTPDGRFDGPIYGKRRR
jgi:hypothetical protein